MDPAEEYKQFFLMAQVKSDSVIADFKQPASTSFLGCDSHFGWHPCLSVFDRIAPQAWATAAVLAGSEQPHYTGSHVGRLSGIAFLAPAG